MIRTLKKRGVYNKDIAAELGVHPRTVSWALFRSGGASNGVASSTRTSRASTICWVKAKASFEALGIDYRVLIVHHDQNPVHTGYRWTGQLLLADGVRMSYSDNVARDNFYMESFFSRNHSLFLETESFEELAAVVAKRIDYYNSERRHSRISYRAPMELVKGQLVTEGRPPIPH